jgi:hypothetical protein
MDEKLTTSRNEEAIAQAYAAYRTALANRSRNTSATPTHGCCPNHTAIALEGIHEVACETFLR